MRDLAVPAPYARAFQGVRSLDLWSNLLSLGIVSQLFLPSLTRSLVLPRRDTQMVKGSSHINHF